MTGRDEAGHEALGLRRKAATLASILALIALIVGSLFGDRGMLHLVAQREHAQALEREIETLRTENGRLAQEIRALKTDPRAIERLAREQLGLARPGESVFLIHEESSPDRP
jgi:cell division protein FtsB